MGRIITPTSELARKGRAAFFPALGPGYDPDAAAFFAAAGITSTTQKSAWNQCVLDLKGFSLWSTILRIYPIIGGTAAQHQWDAKNLTHGTFVGGVTHNANGITGDGATGYFDTGLNGLTDTTANSLSFWVYSRTNIAETAKDIGTSGTASNNCGIFLRYTDNTAYFDNDESLGRCSGASSDSSGLFMSSRTAINAHSGYRNGSVIATTTGAQNIVNGTNFCLLLGGTGGGNTFSSKTLAGGGVGSGWTSTQAANFRTAIQTFQTALGREV